MKWWGGIAIFLAVLISGQDVSATSVTDHVVINEIMANPATGEVEWIELYNPTDEVVNMNGWRLVVTSGNFSGVFASDVTIASHGYVVRKASDTASKLNNTSATITLRPSASGTAIDTVIYNGIAQAKTYARECDASDGWIAQATPTEGAANCVSTLPKDTTLPIIANILTATLSGVVSIDISATDETSLPTIHATLSQYGVEIANIEDSGSATMPVDTTILPNGPATLTITATDAAGNVATKLIEMTIYNLITTQPPTTDPVAKPVVVPTTEPEVSAPIELISPSVIATPLTAVTAVAVPTLRTIATATATTPKVVASPTIISTASRTAASVDSKTQNSSSQTIPVSELARTAPSGGGTSTQKITSNASPQVTFYLVAAGVGCIVISVALWRYLRRTKP